MTPPPPTPVVLPQKSAERRHEEVGENNKNPGYITKVYQAKESTASFH